MMNTTFIVTKEHRRFTEFANAVRKERTIGICHGDAGVGKTLSARRYANWDDLEPYITEWGPRGDQDEKHYALANRSRTVFYRRKIGLHAIAQPNSRRSSAEAPAFKSS